ncbi:MAG: tetratricopeptide repeat protein [Chthoniobacteraceae bacterium]|nr:tetratricopeptide repeat protein [Chthoniobacteraceae bacterium]
MSAIASQPHSSGARTFVVAMALLGVVAVGETGVLVWQLFGRTSPVATVPASAVPGQVVATPKPPDKTQEEAAAAEKSLIASLPKPTPTPAPTPQPTPARPVVTPQSQVAELIGMAKELRDRGDTGTAMTRLRQAQGIFSNYAPIISEMAITYEKMGLTDKAIEQWRRIYQMGERAGIYYAAAEAKLRALQLPDAASEGTAASATSGTASGGLTPDTAADAAVVFSLGKVGTTDDTGTTQPARRLKLAVPILARSGSHVDPRDVVIQVFFYEMLRDGTVVETNANVTSSWARRMNPEGEVQPVDWSTSAPETLEVTYAQPEFDPKDPRPRERRNYFGYSVRVYYKGVLNAKLADPARLLGQFIPPAALPSTDLPQ